MMMNFSFYHPIYRYFAPVLEYFGHYFLAGGMAVSLNQRKELIEIKAML